MEFLEMALLDFGIADVPASKAQRLWKLQTLLIDGYRAGKISALIVDEAHKLNLDVLEELRLLGNFEESDRKLLQIILVGQPELDQVLNSEELRQLKQRIALRVVLGPLNASDVEPYIRHRWTVAGGGEPPFAPEAILRVASISKAIPRIINSLCENSLMLAVAEGVKRVESRHVQLAAGDLQWAPSVEQPPAVDKKPDVNGRAPTVIARPPVIEKPARLAIEDVPLKRTVAMAAKRSGWPKWRERLGFDSPE
jgi:general secretion pathway protein A